MEKVRADFDIFGTLIRARSIDKKNFLRQFGPNAYLCWRRLEDHINDERRRRNFEPYMRDFEWVAKEADRYWHGVKSNKKNIELSEVNVYGTDSDGP